MGEDEFRRVPVKFIDDLSQKIEHLQQSLRRKQRILNKVIARQQKVIRRQQRLLLSFSENPVELGTKSFDKQRSANKDPWTSKNGNNGKEGGKEDVVEREESTTGDSAMDEAW